MSLTGVPLLLVSIAVTLAAAGLAVRWWARGGRYRIALRTALVLACEASLLFTAGLVVNRALGDLFPSWAALFDQDRPAPSPSLSAGPVSNLDGWLRGQDGHAGLMFAWHVPAGWHLPEPPTVYVPPRYFTAAGERFPVVLVLAPVGTGPAPQIPHDDPTQVVLVFVRTSTADERLFGRTLPAQLGKELRTLPQDWGVVGIAGDGRLALDLLAREPTRFGAAAAVQPDGTPEPSPADGQPTLVTASLPAALHWVYLNLPAPLAAPRPPTPTAMPVPAPRPDRTPAR